MQPGASPGDVLEYTLDVQISDFFQFDDLVIDDDFSDGQRFDSTFTPTFVFTENGVTTSGTFDPSNFNVNLNAGTTGRTDVFFDLTGEHGDALTGDLFGSDTTQSSATTVQVTYRTVIQENFSDTFPSGDASVDIGDILDNDVVVTGVLPSGQTETDTSAAQIEIVGPSITKSVYAINLATDDSGDPIGAGISTTYRITLELPTADAENLVLTDYLPLPIFNASTVTTFDTTLGPTATPPPIGVATWGPGHTLDTIVPSTDDAGILSTDPVSNTVTFDFGSFDDPQSRPATIDILFTVAGEDVRMADGLTLANQVQASYGSTNAGTVTNSSLAFSVVSAPELNITKGVVATDAVSPTFSDPVGPVAFGAPGTTPSFAGGITSANLATTPIDSNLVDADAGDLVRFALVIENTGTADAFNLVIQDSIPPEYLTPAGGLNLQVRDGDGNLLTFTGADTDLFTTGIEIDDPGVNDGAVGDKTEADALGDGSNIIVITYDLELATAITPDTVYTNTALIDEYGAVDGGADYTAGSSNPNWTDDATVETLDLVPTKTLVTTSEISTGVFGGVERVTIGEIVRYQLSVEIPEGTINDFNFRDRLPAGLQFLDDGTATVAFVSNGTGITSTDGSAGLALGLGTAPQITGNAPVSPTFVLPDVNVGSTASLNSNTDNYGSSVDPFFKLGTIVNADSDADSEYVVVEFNALVLNSTTNNNNTLRRNSFDARQGAVTSATSNAVDVRITEPSITNLEKTANPTTGDAGDTITFTVTYSNSAAATRTSAFDAQVLDTLPADYTLNVGSVNVVLGNGSVGVNDNSAGNTVDVTIDEVPTGGTVSITYTATLNVTVQPGETLINTADLTYTSLPGTNGTTVNPTGSTTPGIPGSPTGERDGSGGVNDYSDTDNASVTVPSPAIAKSLVGTSIVDATNANNQAVIGETIQYSVVVSIPEGTTNVANIVDTLDAGLTFVSFDSITTSAGVTSDAGDLNSTATITPATAGQNVTFNLGNLTNANTDNATAETITLVYTVRVDNVVSNQGDGTPGTLVNNSALFGWTENGVATATAPDAAAQVEIIEPNLDISKTVSPASVDGGDSLTYTIVIDHNAISDTNAFDVTFSDQLPPEVTVAFPSGVTVTHSTDGDITNLFELTATGELRTIPGSSFDLLLGETVTLSVTGSLSPTVSPGSSFTNTASVDWTSLDGDDPNERNGDGGVDDYTESASATNSVPIPTIEKTLIGTGIVNANNLNDEAVIGETVQYQVVINLPESVLDEAMIVDNLSLGLAFVSLDNIETLSGGVPTNLVTSSVGPFTSLASFAPTVAGNGSATPQQLDFDFGTLTNSDNDNPELEQLVLTYTVRVVNTVTNQNDAGPGTMLNNVATLTWDNGGTTLQTLPDSADEIEVIEPDLVIDKSVAPITGDAGDTVTYSIDIEHSGISDTDAFDIEFSDAIPPQINVNFPADVTVIHSTLGDITASFQLTAGNVLETIPGNEFDLLFGETVSITVDGILDVAVQPTETLTNDASICWTSIDGSSTFERTGADGEAGALNDYCASDNADITIDAPTLAKELVATSIVNANNANDEAVIGETVQYRITVDVPEGSIDSAEIIDNLDLGLEFISLDSIAAFSAGAATTDLVSSLGSFGTTASFAPAVAGDGSATAQTLTFDLGDLTNNNTTNANVETLVLTYTVRVLNIPGNTSNGAGTERV